MGGARWVCVLAGLGAALGTTAVASASSLIAVQGETAAMPVDSPCGGRAESVGLITGRGPLRRLRPGPTAQAVRVASGRAGFAVSWSARGRRAISAPLEAMGGLGEPFRHAGPASDYLGGSDLAVGPRGDRVVVWEGREGVRLQRVGMDGVGGAPLLVRGNDASVDTGVLATNRTGSTWVAAYRDLYEGLWSRGCPARTPQDGRSRSPSATSRPREACTTASMTVAAGSTRSYSGTRRRTSTAPE